MSPDRGEGEREGGREGKIDNYPKTTYRDKERSNDISQGRLNPHLVLQGRP